MSRKKFSRTQQRQLDTLRDTVNSQLERVREGETVSIPLPQRWSSSVVDRIKRNLNTHEMQGEIRYADNHPVLNISLKAA
ncbi:MAG: hypothetical protein CMI52_05130 [Parcubacteria group bacterium]|nr:hypothetical protein [Parcubacteria group bacterium]|tara:strand:- start:352 stop:591 length:240 start_codon:yes stop_codon:yes gene_type:complete